MIAFAIGTPRGLQVHVIILGRFSVHSLQLLQTTFCSKTIAIMGLSARKDKREWRTSKLASQRLNRG